jgi:hypothetical protein
MLHKKFYNSARSATKKNNEEFEEILRCILHNTPRYPME